MDKGIETGSPQGVGNERGWRKNTDGSISINLSEAKRRGLRGGVELQHLANQFNPGGGAQVVNTGEGYDLRRPKAADTSRSGNNSRADGRRLPSMAGSGRRQRGSCLIPILTVGVVGVVVSIFAIRGDGREHYQFQLLSLTPVPTDSLKSTPLLPTTTRTPLTLMEGAPGSVISAYQTLRAQGAQVTIVPAGQETPWAIKAK